MANNIRIIGTKVISNNDVLGIHDMFRESVSYVWVIEPHIRKEALEIIKSYNFSVVEEVADKFESRTHRLSYVGGKHLQLIK